jgi:hypothetical protein
MLKMIGIGLVSVVIFTGCANTDENLDIKQAKSSSKIASNATKSEIAEYSKYSEEVKRIKKFHRFDKFRKKKQTKKTKILKPYNDVHSIHYKAVKPQPKKTKFCFKDARDIHYRASDKCK